MANVDAGTAVRNGATLSGHSNWTCRSQKLLDVFLPVYLSHGRHLTEMENGDTNGCSPVLLEQEAEDSRCVLTVRCASEHPSSICSLVVISEARTIEVYSHNGDYCGTSRAERDSGIQTDSEDRGPFYKNHLILEPPAVSCDVKLLSLGGRGSVAVSRVIVGVRRQEPSPAEGGTPGLGVGPGVDMQRVQTLVDEMGSSLSPGAQSLMDMVNVQQKNQASALGGLLPLLMSGSALSALVRGNNGPLATARDGPFPPMNMAQLCTTAIRPLGDPAASALNGTLESDESPSLSAELSLPGADAGASAQPVNRAQLAEVMSRFLSAQTPGQGSGPGLSSSPDDLLPMLQSVCGHVTQLRLDDAAAAASGKTEGDGPNGTRTVDQAMERRLEEMERRLKDHIDHRLDALEQKLEKALLAALPLLSLDQGTKAAPTGEGAAAVLASTQQLHTA